MSNTKEADPDPTRTFLTALTTTREIQKPIEVQEQDRHPHTADEYEIIYNPETDRDHPYEKWRRNQCLRLLCTREIARYLDRRTFVSVSFREAIIYIIFLIILSLITFGSTPVDMFYFSQTMATLYTKQPFISDGVEKTFYEINAPVDIFNYLMSIIEKLLHSFWYTKSDPFESLVEPEVEYFYENKLIGSPQIRQVRVMNGTCEVDKNMIHIISKCYGPYTSANEDTSDLNAPTTYPYSKASKTGSMSIGGVVATYGGGGYQTILPKNRELAEQKILQLKSGRWMDQGTRAIFIEFVVYNGNINLFSIFKLIFEFPPTGGVLPSHWNYIQKLLRYNDSYDYFIFGCEIVFILFAIFFTIQKLLELATLRLKLFKSFWCWIDIIIIVMCYMVSVFNFLLYIKVEKQLPDLVKKENDGNYASFDDMCYLHIMYSYSLAILIAFAFFRILKYLNIVKSMYQLQSTISRATNDILTYCILFFYVYFVFAHVGQLLFGTKLEDYKTFPLAVFALMRSTVGDFNYNKLVQADPLMGPIFFFAFLFLIVFILVNMFIAILVSKYEEVRSEVRIGGAKIFIGDLIKDWFLRVLEKMECHWLLSQIERKRFEKKVRSPTEAIRQYLRQAGYSELEIELFFKKYDITDSKIAAMDEDQLSYKQGEREAPPPLSQKDILRYIVIQKLEYLENHYEAANKLIDQFLSKLNRFDEKKK